VLCHVVVARVHDLLALSRGPTQETAAIANRRGARIFAIIFST
jgi:hypothetical protein